MAEHGSLKERLRAAAKKQSSSADRIAEFDTAEQAAPVDPEPAVKPKTKEKIGVGAPSFDLGPVIAKIKAQMKRLNGKDPEKEALLQARIDALLANQGL